MNEVSPMDIAHIPQNSLDILQFIIDTFTDPIFVKDLQHRYITCNQAFCDFVRTPRPQIIGKDDTSFFGLEECQKFWQIDDQVTSTASAVESEEAVMLADGTQQVIWTRKFPILNEQGQAIGICSIVTDITEIQSRHDEIAQLERQIQEKLTTIETQNAILEQMAVPIIQLWQNILLVPLVGTIDEHRAQQFTSYLLQAISTHSAQIVLIDLTGVVMVDTLIVQYLVDAVQAAQLIGCQAILVGINPTTAQILVSLGSEFRNITTKAVLQQGLEEAFKRLHYKITSTKTA
jgi:rsbT co-antagonist protein RsbR